MRSRQGDQCAGQRRPPASGALRHQAKLQQAQQRGQVGQFYLFLWEWLSVVLSIELPCRLWMAVDRFLNPYRTIELPCWLLSGF